MRKKIVLPIRDMSCINCQSRIEKALKKEHGILSATVSYEKGNAVVEYEDTKISRNSIEKIVEAAGYHIGRGSRIRTAGLMSLIIVLFFILQKTGVQNMLTPGKLSDSTMSYGMLFIVGLLTSVHCIAMCGGINMSQCIDAEEKTGSALLPAFFYNLGRVVSYTAIGFFLGLIGMTVTGVTGAGLPTVLQGALKLIAGTFMVLMGINMLNLFPRLRKIQIRLPRKVAEKINGKKRGEKRPFIVGLLNGLMPCGPLQSIEIVALGSGNPLSGAFSMLMFSLGTVPLMMGLGGIVSILGKKTRLVMQCGSILVVVLGLSMASQGAGLIGVRPVVSKSAIELNIATVSDTGDAQYVESNLDFGTYPDITVFSGIPVKWTIHVPEETINGCNYKFMINAYGIEHELTPGDNLIEFTPKKAGTVSYTCWMGMIYGTINIVEK